jgi:hypothetical protein
VLLPDWRAPLQSVMRWHSMRDHLDLQAGSLAGKAAKESCRSRTSTIPRVRSNMRRENQKVILTIDFPYACVLLSGYQMLDQQDKAHRR